MEVAMGVLRWSPPTFWGATYLELTAAYAGYARARGIGPWGDGARRPGAPWTAAEVRRARAELAELKARFPDRPVGSAEPCEIRRPPWSKSTA